MLYPISLVAVGVTSFFPLPVGFLASLNDCSLTNAQLFPHFFKITNFFSLRLFFTSKGLRKLHPTHFDLCAFRIKQAKYI